MDLKRFKVATILGTRPEITKLSPLIPLLDAQFSHILIHTGQHYDYNMDKIFFSDLNLRAPDYTLNVGSKTHAKQVAEMIIKIEEIFLEEKPDCVIIFADPNTPLAGALVASKLNIPLIHLEAGCRSFNKKMPEEINRIVCDHCADLLLAPDTTAVCNLLNEGIKKENIHLVGSLGIESSLRNAPFAEKSSILKELNLEKEKYALVTIHRAENTNSPKVLKELMDAISSISEKIKVVFPLHPRTKKIIEENQLQLSENIRIIEPQGYLDFLHLLQNSLFIMSDSGGIQEEAAALNIPCLILRNETEWTYLIQCKKNLLLGTQKESIVQTVKELLENQQKIVQMKNVKLNLNSNVAQKIMEIIKNEFR